MNSLGDLNQYIRDRNNAQLAIHPQTQYHRPFQGVLTYL